MDLVLGTEFLGKHDVTVQARKSQLSIAAQPSPIVLRAKPHSPTGPEDTRAAVELLNAAQFARHCKLQGPEDHAFLGYINELVTATEAMLVARTDPQPPEYKRHKANLREEFKDILCDNIPPGLPPVRRLRDGRILEHAIPLKPTAKQPYRLSETELTEVRTQITTQVNQGWIRLSLSPWGAPMLFQWKNGWDTPHVHRLPGAQPPHSQTCLTHAPHRGTPSETPSLHGHLKA
jgi:hypothetical protein